MEGKLFNDAHCLDYTASNSRMTNYENGRDLEERFCDLNEVLSRNLRGGTQKNYDTQSRCPVHNPRIELTPPG
jgi:hypothetical protein